MSADLSPGDRAYVVAFWGSLVAAALLTLALLLWSGCSSSGGICETDDSCAPLERCEARRCVAPGGPAPKGNPTLPEPELPGKTPGRPR